MEHQEKIELRSENLRNFIGQVPPLLTRIGTVIVTVLFAVLCFAAYTIPYPFTIEAEGIVLEENDTGEEMQLRLAVPYRYYGSFREDLEVSANLEGWDDISITGNVTHFSDSIVTIGHENYFYAYTSLKKGLSGHRRLQPNLKVSATVVFNDKTVWQRVFNK